MLVYGYSTIQPKNSLDAQPLLLLGADALPCFGKRDRPPEIRGEAGLAHDRKIHAALLGIRQFRRELLSEPDERHKSLARDRTARIVVSAVDPVALTNHLLHGARTLASGRNKPSRSQRSAA